MQKHDSLIFDLDGTLWDSTKACAAGWTEGVRQFYPQSQSFTPQDLASIMGMTFDKAVEKLMPHTEATQREKLGQVCYEKEMEQIQKMGAPLYEGVAEGIQTLASSYPLYIVSNCLADYLLAFYQMTGLQPFFKDAECFGRTGKPKGHNIQAVIQRNQLVSPAYIGDTSGDQTAAMFAGATYYHVNYGFGTPSQNCERFPSFQKLTQYFVAQK
ncbi:MAG: HAD family hydrolase [Proteobacteria bacterium]|nr:HAD family hydrolase [Pseudomonadota bacterium]NDC23163.1 HAD family hydrolase [Pseudomonadota bacterium]NDD03373.1 HAD family hydrolase [Pseudomonadota bacterium]NDG25580.1 HAD family hydrolase [Pseudomonadota bacterium]